MLGSGHLAGAGFARRGNLVILLVVAGSGAGCGTTTVPAPTTQTVNITGFKFSPEPIRVLAGDTVLWTNQDQSQHTSTSDDGTEWDSPRLDRGADYSRAFSSPGTFKYHCAVHPFIHGTVIVSARPG